ncbi:hypothetical protein DdX_22287 [Ditylenchus destructor]|uniref:DUF2306 domain-containing protein n=1 Tax=Ditylenchus destructor TaxID=166010 RepID=A0AAD4MI64_9BILA|nr:hypothetical protein DdX_22287 [Ditylenchus destructor]
MATAYDTSGVPRRSDDGFFLWSAFAMAAVLVAGFSLHLAAGGRASARRSMSMHTPSSSSAGSRSIARKPSSRRADRWSCIAGSAGSRRLGGGDGGRRDRDHRAADPCGSDALLLPAQHFLIANPLMVTLFAGLTVAAVRMRRRTDWHRRLHMCAMIALLGPGFGRLLPMPLMIPRSYQIASLPGLLFLAAGMIGDYRRDGRVHPAWWWGPRRVSGRDDPHRADRLFAPWLCHLSGGYRGSPGAVAAPLDFAPFPSPMG